MCHKIKVFTEVSTKSVHTIYPQKELTKNLHKISPDSVFGMSWLWIELAADWALDQCRLSDRFAGMSCGLCKISSFIHKMSSSICQLSSADWAQNRQVPFSKMLGTQVYAARSAIVVKVAHISNPHWKRKHLQEKQHPHLGLKALIWDQTGKVASDCPVFLVCWRIPN